MNLTFVQLSAFASRWKGFRLTDEDLQALERQLLKNPGGGDVVRGTGGLRKVRFSPPSRHSGKSGAYRVGFAYFRVASTVYLFTIFAKADQANLTTAECNAVKRVMESLAKFHAADSAGSK